MEPGHETVNFRGQEVKGQGHSEAEGRFGGLAEASFWTPMRSSRSSGLCVTQIMPSFTLFWSTTCVS